MGQGKKLAAAMAKGIVPWTDHIIFVGPAEADAPVVVVGRDRGNALIGAGEPDGGGGAWQFLGRYESDGSAIVLGPGPLPEGHAAFYARYVLAVPSGLGAVDLQFENPGDDWFGGVSYLESNWQMSFRSNSLHGPWQPFLGNFLSTATVDPGAVVPVVAGDLWLENTPFGCVLRGNGSYWIEMSAAEAYPFPSTSFFQSSSQLASFRLKTQTNVAFRAGSYVSFYGLMEDG